MREVAVWWTKDGDCQRLKCLRIKYKKTSWFFTRKRRVPFSFFRVLYFVSLFLSGWVGGNSFRKLRSIFFLLLYAKLKEFKCICLYAYIFLKVTDFLRIFIWNNAVVPTRCRHWLCASCMSWCLPCRGLSLQLAFDKCSPINRKAVLLHIPLGFIVEITRESAGWGFVLRFPRPDVSRWQIKLPRSHGDKSTSNQYVRSASFEMRYIRVYGEE